LLEVVRVTREDVFSKLSKIFEEVMDIDEVDLHDDTTAADIEEWDSLSHVRLIVSVERSFGIRFTNKEVEQLRTVGELVDAILEKKAA
jgi:acyl carrier protein